MGAVPPQGQPDPRIELLQRNLPWAKSDQPASWYTSLPHDQEMAFRSWVTQNKVPFNPDEPMPDYDMRGYYAKTRGRGWQEGAHFPDTWKTPLHQSFSRESKYANDQAPFWKGESLIRPDGTVVYQEPSKVSDTFVTDFLKNKRNNPDDIYSEYLKNVSALGAPKHDEKEGLFSRMVSGARNIIPFVDSAVGHQYLNDALKQYPFTPEIRKLASKTLVRTSSSKEVEEEEAEEDPEKILGMKTGRERVLMANKIDLSPPLSVMTHELMHSYLNQHGYPYGADQFTKDWNTTKQQSPLLNTIDSFIASSPDYADEMNQDDITQERYAYLAQALGGAGLQAFPLGMRRHYQAIFTDKK